MTNNKLEKRTALDWIDTNYRWLSDFHGEIWNYAETAYREYRSAGAYVELLRSHGFTVEEGSGDMPTAFQATWGSGGPVLGTYAEYDAVPGNSQQPVPYRAPRDGLHPWAPGHTDPHSSQGVAALMGVLGAQEAMERHGLGGTLRFSGEPAENVCGAKPAHAAKGYLDGADAYISYRPNSTNTTVWDTHCGSFWSVVFQFECTDPETWADPRLSTMASGPPTTARCPGAIDAVCLMYTNTKYTKEAMLPHTGTWSLNEFIMAAGQCTTENTPPRFAAIQYSWRSSILEMQERIFQVLETNARHAAELTGCTVSRRWVTKTRVGLPNHALADLTYRNLEQVGPPSYSVEAADFARQIQGNLGLRPMDDPFTEANQRLTTPQEWEDAQRQGLPPWQVNYTSDDYVDYTWHAPTVHLYTARPQLRAPEPGYTYPAWATNAMGGVPECIEPGMFVAGKTIAATLVDLITDPAELEKARSEFVERTGGGVGGSRWVAPLLPSDFRPPVDLRWPEYIRTQRGEEWWIPTPIA